MLFVDGHNLTFGHDSARRKLLAGDPEGSRRQVLECVRAYASSTKDRAMVVFDGSGGEASPGGTGRVHYCFAGEEQDADAEILRRIRGHSGGGDVRLVTDDRALAAAARRLGAKTIGLKKFLIETHRLKHTKRDVVAPEPAGKYRGPSPAEVEYWLAVFSDDDVRRAEEEPPNDPARRKR